jgi:hypothetical protein
VQDRKPFSYETDLKAELPLYVKTKSLISHIMEIYIKSKDNNFMKDFPKSVQQLWIDLYEYGFVELEDVESATLWLKALSQVGYEFPSSLKVNERKNKISGEHKRLLSGGKTLYELSRKYMDKLYQGKHYLNSTCLFNNAGKHII